MEGSKFGNRLSLDLHKTPKQTTFFLSVKNKMSEWVLSVYCQQIWKLVDWSEEFVDINYKIGDFDQIYNCARLITI